MSGGGGGRDDGYVGSIRPASNGGGPPGGGGSGGGDPDQCAIAQRAPLNSPVPAVVATLRVGEELDIVLATSSGRPILEVRKGGSVAGALTHRGHLTLIRCIGDGWTYKAIVTSISSGLVELRIQPA